MSTALAVLPRPGPPTSRQRPRTANVSSGSRTKLRVGLVGGQVHHAPWSRRAGSCVRGRSVVELDVVVRADDRVVDDPEVGLPQLLVERRPGGPGRCVGAREELVDVELQAGARRSRARPRRGGGDLRERLVGVRRHAPESGRDRAATRSGTTSWRCSIGSASDRGRSTAARRGPAPARASPRVSPAPRPTGPTCASRTSRNRSCIACRRCSPSRRPSCTNGISSPVSR